MKEKDEKNTKNLLKSKGSFDKKSIFFISSVFFIIILLFFSNTIYMRYQLMVETSRYVSDISKQTVSNLSNVLKETSLCIEEMADSFSRDPELLLTEEMLQRKASIWKLDGIACITSEGQRVAGDIFCDLFYEWLEVHPEVYEETEISYILNHKVLFSSPIQKEGEEKAVLIGVKKYDTIQKFLADINFQRRGVSLIADSSGTVIFSPDDKREAVLSDVVTEKVKQGYEGMVEVKEEDGSRTLISIQPLHLNDWKLLMITPQTFLLETSMKPIFNFFLIILFSIMVFFMILRYIYRSQKTVIQKLRTFSFVDSVTGGMNGLAFQLEAQNILRDSKKGSYVLVFLNVLNFKQINERWGSAEGNRVLKYIYQTISDMLETQEYIARSEVDHYFLLLHNMPEKEFITRIQNMIQKLNTFKNDHKEKEEKFLFDFSIGAYVLEDMEEEFRLSEGKARRASAVGKGENICTFYDTKLGQKEWYQKHLNDIFDSALEKEQFEIYLQPKMPLNENSVLSAEALVRWVHPEDGMIYPSDFIPLFEKNGKICRLDLYVLEKVCKMLQERQREGKPLFPVSVNLSRANLYLERSEIVEKIVSLKKKYQIPDAVLEMEMTESIMIQDKQLPSINKMIHTFHANGIRCSLDDFGFGFSSLGILKSLNVDVIKFDRKFFMDENEKTWFIVSNFVALAHGLGIKAVAEGIEYENQVECLKKAGCDMIQGYYYGKPMPAAEFIRWYEARGEVYD